MRVDDVAPLLGLARDHRLSLVSPGPIDTSAFALEFVSGSLVRDPDGHGVRLITTSSRR
jgi:hypothetical protein